MDFVQIAVLALIQGITEFLPISSSAHLILVPAVTHWPDQGLAMDVALHMGTLAAVVLYFHRETVGMVRGGVKLVQGEHHTQEAQLALRVVVGTLPVVVAGLILKEQIAHDWREPLLIAFTTIVFGLLLWLADRRGERLRREVADMSLGEALLIGLAQALALVPGVSRSGITMTVALLLSYRRPEAARFSLLLSIPTTLAAGVLGGLDLYQSGDTTLQSDALLAALLAFIAALAAIAALMAWLRRASFRPFVIYRLLLGAGLLGWWWVQTGAS